ncbi:MAG: RluA family pseudouridine synthase [Clostridia bacterium]|nr:RluA family pseudouridine synthase [Clostridia bacterium]
MAETIRPEILYCDGDIAVCVKPAGVLSEDGPDAKGLSMPGLLREFLSQNNEKTDIYTVHRLDAGTRGVMVYARTKVAAARLSEAVRNGSFVKEYEALVNGDTGGGDEETELYDLLLKDSSKNKVYVVKTMRKGVREARLSYTVKEKRGDMTLLRVKLITGRSHQIRVQFASRGFPLAGDRKYGAKDGSDTIGLCAVKITFPHPSSGKPMSFEIDPNL